MPDSSSSSTISSIPAFLNPSESELKTILDNLYIRERNRYNLSCNTSTGEHQFSSITAQINHDKNRYNDIVAYDQTRIIFPEYGVDEYINASIIKSHSIPLLEASDPLNSRMYIAAQAPIASTVHTFLSLLLLPSTSLSHQPSPPLAPPKLIVQLTKLTENGRSKCDPYFPKVVGSTEIYSPSTSSLGKRKIWVKLVSKEENAVIRSSALLIGWVGKNGQVVESEGNEVLHTQYRAWPDHGVPSDPSLLVQHISKTDIRQQQLNTTGVLSNASVNGSSSQSSSPILLHCSAGVGRTGTYITLSFLTPLLSQLAERIHSHNNTTLPIPSSSSPSVIGPYPAIIGKGKEIDWIGLTIDGLRDQRTTMVQNEKQVEFCFEALRGEWLKSRTI